jgi:hypothetical protein
MIRSLLLVLALLGCSAHAADDKAAWQEPFELQLPEPTRTIGLKTRVDTNGFLANHGIESASVIPMGRSGTLVEVAMSDSEWQTLADQVCELDGVTGCGTTVCQGIQLTGTAEPGDQYSPEAVQARLVQQPPEGLPEIPEDADGEAGTCHGPPLIPPLDQAAASGAGQNLTIDLSLIESDGDKDLGKVVDSAPTELAESDLAESVVEPGPESATDGEAGSGSSAEIADSTGGETAAVDAANKGFRFSLKSVFNPIGGVDLGTDDLPADTTDWMLVVGAGCTEIKVPLSAIEPARLPGIVTALVDAANVNAVAGAYGLTVVRQLPLTSTGQNLAVYATAQNIFTVIALMALDARVDGAQPEFVYQTTAELGSPVGLDQSAPAYADPFAALTYGPAMTGALELHESSTGKGQLVAVIDTGIDVAHPDLADRLREPVDTTDQGFGPEIHGTAVAGIIAAEAGNAIGSFGVAPQVEILPIKACHPKEAGGLAARCTTSSLVKALDVAITEDASIINMSLAGPPDDLVARFVAEAVSRDRLIIAGAGNGGAHGKPGHPAALPGVLAVTAVDIASRPYAQANRGTYIDVAAPGVDIVSTAPEGRYPPLSGTSMAAAHVTGIAALIRELQPTIGARELGIVLKGNAQDLGDPGLDERFGMGMVDACGSAAAATANAVSCGKGEADENELSF